MKRHSTFTSSPKPLKKGRLKKKYTEMTSRVFTGPVVAPGDFSKPKKKVKKAKAKSLGWWKAKADTSHSLCVRLQAADSEGNVRCYTCGKVMMVKEAQCGHFVSRQHNSTRWDFDNTRVQCVGCNVFGGGRVATYAERLDKELGARTVARLYRKANVITPIRIADLQKICEEREILLARINE